MTKRIIVALSLVLIIGVFASLSVYFGLFMVQIDTILMDLEVAQRVSFNTDTDALHFGSVYKGGESTRTLNIANQNHYPVIINIENQGDFAHWVALEKNHFTLPPNSSTAVQFTAQPPMYAQYGEYSGQATIKVKRKLW